MSPRMRVLMWLAGWTIVLVAAALYGGGDVLADFSAGYLVQGVLAAAASVAVVIFAAVTVIRGIAGGRMALWSWPSLGAVRKQMGTIARQVEHMYVDALPSLESAVQLTPSDAGAWARLSYALARAGRDAEAMTASERALALDPRCAAAWTSKATVLVSMGRPEEALAACNYALALDRQDASKLVRDGDDAWAFAPL